MKKILLSIAFIMAGILSTYAQVDNYSLRLDASGSVDVGNINELDGLENYTVQCWINPSTWTPNAAIFSRGSNDSRFELSLGAAAGQVKFTVGNQSVNIVSADLAANTWTQITIMYESGTVKAYINNASVLNSSAQLKIPASSNSFYLGNNFIGRIDEFRIWSTILPTEYVLWRNTINKYHPQWNNLIVYYKFDQNLCPNLVDYKFNHHGTFSSTGAVREKVTDNTAFKYRIQSAYTNFSRWADRAIDKEKYLLSNDLLVLGVESNSNGDITMPFPDNQGTLSNANYLESYAGRNGVVSFNGAGAKMDVGTKALLPDTKYSLHTWINLDEWTEGAYIFKKESSNTQGFSIRLGDPATNQLIVRLNGQEYKRKIPTTVIANPVGTWWNLGVVAFGLDQGASKVFMFTFNGKPYFSVGSDFPATVPTTLLPQNVATTSATLGENLKGKLDETVIWNTDLSESSITSYMNGLPMPGFSKIVEAASVLYKMNSFWNYDKVENPGYDSYSYKNFIAIMRSAYDGYRGYTIRMSVSGHDNWQATISDAAKRVKMAQGIVEAATEFDGIDLDFEWCYDGTCFNNYGLLLDEIGKIMPTEKIFTISPHYVSYALAPKYMKNVDYFFFQIYGPSTNVFTWNTYLDAYNRFIAQGYPKDKIVMSYATTTSKATTDMAGNNVTAAAPIGVRNGLLDGNYTPDMNVVMDGTGTYRFITGVNQTRQRSEFIHDKDLAGIMYWDMGNDVPTAHPYSIPKASNFALASNVDTVITQVIVKPNAIQRPKSPSNNFKVYPNPAFNSIRLIMGDHEDIDYVNIYSSNGQLMLTKIKLDGSEKIDITTLPFGLYSIRVNTQLGNTFASTFVKK